MAEKIDFVVLWVDGADPQWQRQQAQYAPEAEDNGSDINRFRDWELMRYWFRCTERFAPWVNRVYFVTNGQVPSWLNREHPKLKLVKHSDYIPAEFLPTFNSNVIELWLHKLPGLSEHFVLFNDDMFLTAPVEPSDFFVNGLPRESALLDIATAASSDDCLPHMLINNGAILNKHFCKKDVLKRHAGMFFTLQYGKDLIRNVLLAPFQYFSTFRDPHLPSSHRKSTFRQVWTAERELLMACSQNRFRSKGDLTHWLMKCWQICEGNFVVRPTSWGCHYELWEDSIDGICADLAVGKYKAVCLNDSKTDIDFDALKSRLTQAFDALVSQPSGFERDI